MKRRFLAAGFFVVAIALVQLASPGRAQPPGKQFPFKKGLPQPGKSLPTAALGFNDQPSAEQVAFFEKKIRPVLIDQCAKCHSSTSEKLKGGLVLDTRDGLRKGGDSGPSIAPGSPERSLLIKALRFTDNSMQMPPKGKLPDDVIADFEAWVTMGAPDPRGALNAGAKTSVIDIAKGREFWSFQKPVSAPAPGVKSADWAYTDIDRYLLAGLELKGLKPVGDAERATLIRRVYLDLVGVPPTADEANAFVNDASPKAYEKVVDRLLTDPRFGERWGRHWLDVARYAESSGKTANFNYPHAWRYRDYVIGAFNADKPYDQFVREQIAGDLMPTNDPKLKAERSVATGFLAIGPKALNERNGLQFELDVADEQLDVTTQAFLGLTAACARCHDHKFDPIPQSDYYALAGIFRSTETCYGTVRFVQSQRPSELILLAPGSATSAIKNKLTPVERESLNKQVTALQKKMAESDRLMNIFNAAQLSTVRSKLDSYEADGTPKLLAMGVRDKPSGGFGGRPGFGARPGGPGGFGGFGGSRTAADSPIYIRGETDKPGAVVTRGFLQVLTTDPVRIRTGSGRKELAEWIASRDNPLTARVMVNRVWLHLFGRGIVPTPDNFGAAGRLPDNPALLDHLAVTFMDDGWSVKKLIRRIVLSHAYRLDSKTDPKNLEADPDNVLVWRMSPLRLDAEAFRDSVLAVSGQLNVNAPVGSVVAQAGEGPTTRPRVGGDGITQALNDPRNTARSVYLPAIRDNMPEVLSLFDAADPSLVVSERPVTTTPAQGLFLLNSPFVMRAADAAADDLMKSTTTDSERVRAAYLSFFGRPPTDQELKAASGFLKAYRATAARDRIPTYRAEKEVWSTFCQALFCSAEFQYRK